MILFIFGDVGYVILPTIAPGIQLAFRTAREYQRRVSASVEDVAAVVRKPSTALPLGVKPHKYNDFGLMAMNDASRVTAASTNVR